MTAFGGTVRIGYKEGSPALPAGIRSPASAVPDCGVPVPRAGHPVATGGLAVFLSGAMMYDVPNGYLMGVSLVCVGLISLFCLGWKTAIIGGVCTAGLTVWQCIVHAELLPELRYAPLALYNGCLRRLETAGYPTFSSMSVSYSSTASEEQLLGAGMAGVILLFALVYTLCLLRRANLLPPAIMSTAVLTILMTFNVYSNRIQSNLGIVLVIVSFAAVLVMAACDRVYRPVAGHGRGAAEELLPRSRMGNVRLCRSRTSGSANSARNAAPGGARGKSDG